MNSAGFLRVHCAPAVCEGPDDRRSTADRIWAGRIAPPAHLFEAARAIAARCPAVPGRVHALGDFTDSALHALLRAELPAEPPLRLRERFEWYACRGAAFHNDAHYGGVLFGVCCVAGPGREIVFPRVRLRAGASYGDLAVFDPFEPHAVLDPARERYAREDYEGAAPGVYVGFEIELDESARIAFGVGAPPAAGVRLSSAIAINAETGALR